MNTQHDDLEHLLESGLRDRADHVGTGWVDIQDVRGRATSIRRRRRAVAAVGVAAAVAVIAPLALSLGGTLDTDREIAPAPPAPSRTAPVRTTLTLDGLERGDAPAVEYFTPDGVVLPGDGVRELGANYQALVPSDADGGWLALGPSKDDLLSLTDSFEQVGTRPVTQTFVSNADRSLVAWTELTEGQQVLTLHSTTGGEDLTWDFPSAQPVDPVDFVGDDSLLFTTNDQGKVAMGVARPDGSTTMLNGDWVGALSANPKTGLVAVQTRTNPDTSGCFGVVDPAQDATATVWESCEYSLGAFSPDGRYVLASGAQQSGAGPTSLSVLEAGTGDLVASFESKGRTMVTLMHVVWESSDSVVSVAAQGNTTMMVRFQLDGTLAQATDSVDGNLLDDRPFFLGLDRLRRF